MKIIVTGSLENISKPLTELLVQKGHSVTVISSNPEKQKDIEALCAKATIGSMENAKFLINTSCNSGPKRIFHHWNLGSHSIGLTERVPRWIVPESQRKLTIH